MNDILFAMKSFNVNKAKGLTFIDNIVIKNCMNGITKMFYCLFNKIIDFETIPNKLSKAIVSPILKANKNKQSIDSYRCISVQTNIFRIFEIFF